MIRMVDDGARLIGETSQTCAEGPPWGWLWYALAACGVLLVALSTVDASASFVANRAAVRRRRRTMEARMTTESDWTDRG